MSRDFSVACADHMATNNLPISIPMISDGKIHRYSADGKADRDEWYIAHEGVTYRGNHYMVCVYGSWSEGTKYIYKSFEETNVLDYKEREQLRESLKEKRDAAERLLQEGYELSAAEASVLWLRAEEKAPNSKCLEYALEKRIDPIGVRFDRENSAMIIPVRNVQGELRSLQFIIPNDNGTQFIKRFLPGGQKKGNFFMFGKPVNGRPLVIVEGYATGASVYEATFWPVVVAFDAGNLMSVAQVIRWNYPNVEMIIGADADEIGLKKAKLAAATVGAKIVYPFFPSAEGENIKDWNDLFKLYGPEIVKRQLLQQTVSYYKHNASKAYEKAFFNKVI